MKASTFCSHFSLLSYISLYRNCSYLYIVKNYVFVDHFGEGSVCVATVFESIFQHRRIKDQGEQSRLAPIQQGFATEIANDRLDMLFL